MVQLGLRRQFLKIALNLVLIVQPYSRQRELQESYLNIFYLPIFDRFMAYGRSKQNFGPNVRYCFLGFNEIICYSFLQAIVFGSVQRNISFMVQSALREQFLKKRQPAKPSMSLFFNCLLSHSDTRFRIYEKKTGQIGIKDMFSRAFCVEQ